MMTIDECWIFIFGLTITVKVIKKKYLHKKKIFFLIYGLFAIIIFEIEEMRK